MVKMQLLSPAEIKAETDDGFISFLREGAVSSELPLETYAQTVETLFRAIELRTTAVANMPRQLEDLETGKILATENWAHPLQDEKGRPLTERRLWADLRLNIPMSKLLWQTEAAQSLLGQAYWLIQRRGRRVVGARWLDPARLTVRYNSEGVSRYDYTRVVGSISSGTDRLPAEDVCRIWRPSLRELEPGTSPAMAAAQSAGLLFNANLFMRVFFANGAMPVTIVMSEDDPTPEERDRLKLFLGRMMRGIRNAFSVEVVSSLLRFEKLTPDIKDLDFTNLTKEKDRAIAVAMGIPFSILFSGTGGSYAQSAEDDNHHFYEKTVVPEAGFIGAELNEQFFNPLGLHLSFRPDLLEIYQQRERLRVEMELQLFDKGAITVDELRLAAGYREPLSPNTAVSAPAPPPALAAPTDDDDEGDEDEEEDRIEAEKRAELKRWESKVLKAMKRGRAAHSVPFAADWLAVWEVEEIRKALRVVGTAEEVRAVMSSPFGRGVGGTLKVAREDDEPLGQIERVATTAVTVGLEAQLRALLAQADTLGGRNADQIVLQVMRVVQEEQEALLGATQRVLYASYERGVTVATGTLAPTARLRVDWQMMSQEARSFAEKYSYNLVTDLNATTEKGLREALVRWIESGGRLEELADSIRPLFANEAATRRIEALFNVDRARMIAETEATRAYAQGKIDTWLQSGEVERGPEVAPPAHPRCRCDIATERQDDGSWLWRWDTARDERVCPICTGYKYVGLARSAPAMIGQGQGQGGEA
jgi:HK97 family phage portal protein